MFDPKASEPYQNIDISNVAKHSSPCSYHGLFYGHAMFIGNSQKEARYLSFPVFIAVASDGYKTDFNLNNIVVTLCLLFLR